MNAGKIATAHEARINFNGWIGEGYTLIDPNTGVGGYIISGGGNGGELTGEAALVGVGVAGVLLTTFTTGVLAVFLPSLGKVLKCLSDNLGPILTIALVIILLILLRATVIGLVAGLAISATASAGTNSGADACGLTCDDHFTNCLSSSIQSQSGPLFGSSACVTCRNQCVQNGGGWPHIARPFSGPAKRCDYVNFP